MQPRKASQILERAFLGRAGWPAVAATMGNESNPILTAGRRRKRPCAARKPCLLWSRSDSPPVPYSVANGVHQRVLEHYNDDFKIFVDTVSTSVRVASNIGLQRLKNLLVRKLLRTSTGPLAPRMVLEQQRLQYTLLLRALSPKMNGSSR